MIDPTPLEAAPEGFRGARRSARAVVADNLMGPVRLILAAGFAATEGFRVLRRWPRAALVWGLMWLVWFSLAAGAIATGRKVVISERAARWTIWELLRHYGPFAAGLIGLFLIVLGMTAIASFRAVLNPDERRYFFLRLGRDEFRVAAISAMAFSFLAVFGGVPAGVLILLASPFMQAAPALAREIGELGAFLTVCLDVWLCVRLSLIGVETFAEHRFHLSAYWPLARGRFWYLFLSYLAIFLILCLMMVVFVTLSESLFAYALNTLGHANLWQRAILLVFAGILAVLAAAYWLVTVILFCAGQARAYMMVTMTAPDAWPPRLNS